MCGKATFLRHISAPGRRSERAYARHAGQWPHTPHAPLSPHTIVSSRPSKAQEYRCLGICVHWVHLHLHLHFMALPLCQVSSLFNFGHPNLRGATLVKGVTCKSFVRHWRRGGALPDSAQGQRTDNARVALGSIIDMKETRKRPPIP